MNAESFVKYLDQIAMLYQLPYEELKSLSMQHPYFQNLHLMLALKSKLDDHPDYKKNLVRASTYSVDRKHLFRTLQQLEKIALEENYALEEDFLELEDITSVQQKLEFLEVVSQDEVVNEPSTLESPALDSTKAIDTTDFSWNLPGTENGVQEGVDATKQNITEEEGSPVLVAESDTPLVEQQHSFPELIADSAASLEAIALFHRKEFIKNRFLKRIKALELAVQRKLAEKSQVSPTPKKNFSSWIEQFQPAHLKPRLGELMEAQQRFRKQKTGAKPSAELTLKGDNLPFFAEKSIRDNEHLATETLAEILTAQLQYQKAIRVYERLILIFPEKSTFFAEKIKNLKKLIS